MERNEINRQEYYTIDLLHIAKTLWKRFWIIALAGLLAAVMGFSIARFLIKPQYSSAIMLYVNNSSVSLGNTSFSISSSEISAAQSLVKTYIVMLRNRTTLEAVIDKTNLPYDYETIYGMVEASAVNDTEVMRVKVTCDDPYEAAKIVNAIAEVLPMRIAEIIEGSSMEVVDSGVPILQKVSPSFTKFTAVGFVLGVLISVLSISLGALMDNTIHDEEYVLRTYDYPILAKIPDLLNVDTKKYGKYGYYYRRRTAARLEMSETEGTVTE